MAERTIDGEAVSYPEVVGELGVLIRKLQDTLAPYGGSIKLGDAPYVSYTTEHQTRDGRNVINYVSVNLSVSYNPQELHRGVQQVSKQA
jgi:hypothetical protein